MESCIHLFFLWTPIPKMFSEYPSMMTMGVRFGHGHFQVQLLMKAQIKWSMIESHFLLQKWWQRNIASKDFYCLNLITEGSDIILTTLWGKEEYRDKSQETGSLGPPLPSTWWVILGKPLNSGLPVPSFAKWITPSLLILAEFWL